MECEVSVPVSRNLCSVESERDSGVEMYAGD